MSFAGWAELLVIVIIAFVVIGPKDLPKILFVLGRFLKNLRRFSDEFLSEFEALYNANEEGEGQKISKKKSKDKAFLQDDGM